MIILWFLISLVFSGCINFDEIDTIDLVNNEAEYAIPLVNSTLTLETVLSDQLENALVEYNEEGVAIVKYQADVVRKQSNDIFKPIVFPAPIPFLDTVQVMPFDLLDNYNVKRGIIRGDSVRFGFTNPFSEPVTVTGWIREASLNGEAFERSFVVPASASYVSPMFSIKGFAFESPENHLTFAYDARKSNGERVSLLNGYFEFTYFLFEFVEGFVGKQTLKLYDQRIHVNVFEFWKNGVLEFQDPRIRLRMDNSFGFPVKAVVNHFEVTNLAEQVIPLESTIFNDDIYFEYPSLDEVGELKSTEFIFNKDNSNFATAFNQKVIEVSYDIDAVANPDNDPNSIGFFEFDSYFLLNMAVELPMIFKAQDFQLADHFEIDSLPVDFGLVESFELKAYLTNLFPVDCYVQLYFMDINDNTLDSLFQDGEWHFKAAHELSDGTMQAAGNTEPFYLDYGPDRKELLRQTRKIAPKVRFDTQNNPEEWTRITKNNGLDVKIGLKFKWQ